MGPFLLAAGAPYLPWMMSSLMDCETGASGLQHVVWMAVFVCTCPFTSFTAFGWDSDEAKVPCFNWTVRSAVLYFWFSTLLQSSDQYMDNNVAAMAKACGAHGLWQAMLAVYVGSLL